MTEIHNVLQKIIEVRECILHIGLITKVIRLKLLRDIVPKFVRVCYSRVEWKFSWMIFCLTNVPFFSFRFKAKEKF